MAKTFPPDLFKKALFVATLYDDNEMLSALFLTEQNMDMAVDNSSMVSVLHMAVVRGHDHLVDIIIEAGANKEVRNQFGMTPLASAISFNHSKAVLKLLDAGADLESRNMWLETPLMVSITAGNADIVKILLDRGASVESRNVWGGSVLDMFDVLDRTNQNKIIYEMVNDYAEKQRVVYASGPSL